MDYRPKRFIDFWYGIPLREDFKKDEENPLDTDFIIIDECSMLDISLTASLLKALNHRQTQVLFIGDQDQLPSIGAGNVIKDLISEGQKVPVFRLTQVFRQGSESLIIKYAHQINNGEIPQIDSPFREANPMAREAAIPCLLIRKKLPKKS